MAPRTDANERVGTPDRPSYDVWRSLGCFRQLWIICSVGLCTLTGTACRHAASSAGTDADRGYLSVVQAYADVLLEHGRDSYGDRTSPLIAVALDRERHTLFHGAALADLRHIPRERWGIRSHDRILTGANPMHDENLYQILYALTAATGESRYREEADRALRWFYNHTQSAATGLFAWGEHMGWDFYDEGVVDKEQGDTHEFFRPWVLWSGAYRLAPEAALDFAYGLWRHQISDHETGRFSRHADYHEHGPRTGGEYPRHGGFYIETWARAYQETGDPVFLQAISTLLNYFDRRRSEQSGAIPAEDHPRSEGKLMWPTSNLSLAVSLWEHADEMPARLADTLRAAALRVDDIFLALPHDVGPGGMGFVTSAHTHTLEAVDVRDRNVRPYSRLWATGYGQATDANVVNLILLRYEQRPLEEYKRLVLAGADRYLDTEPDLSFPLYPGTMGDVILLMIGAYELTGDETYLTRADDFAAEALSIFVDDVSPLPKASSEHNHYEAITRGDTLMMALLKLWLVRHRSEPARMLVYTDR